MLNAPSSWARHATAWRHVTPGLNATACPAWASPPRLAQSGPQRHGLPRVGIAGCRLPSSFLGASQSRPASQSESRTLPRKACHRHVPPPLNTPGAFGQLARPRRRAAALSPASPIASSLTKPPDSSPGPHPSHCLDPHPGLNLATAPTDARCTHIAHTPHLHLHNAPAPALCTRCAQARAATCAH